MSDRTITYEMIERALKAFWATQPGARYYEAQEQRMRAALEAALDRSGEDA